MTVDEGQRLRVALRTLGVTQARAAAVLEATQTQLSAWMSHGKGPTDVLARLESAFGFAVDALVAPCPRPRNHVLCQQYRGLDETECITCRTSGPAAGATAPVEGRSACATCGRTDELVRLRPARGRRTAPWRTPEVDGAVVICTHCRNAQRHRLVRCPVCDGWMRAGRARCHRCSGRRDAGVQPPIGGGGPTGIP